MKISEILHNKKGQMLDKLPQIAVILVMCGVIFAIGFTIISKQGDTGATCPTIGVTVLSYDTTTRMCQNGSTQVNVTPLGYVWNATQGAQTGMAQITGYLPTIGLILAAIVVIGLVVGLLYKRG